MGGGERNVKDVIMRWKIFFYVVGGRRKGGWEDGFAADIGRSGVIN